VRPTLFAARFARAFTQAIARSPALRPLTYPLPGPLRAALLGVLPEDPSDLHPGEQPERGLDMVVAAMLLKHELRAVVGRDSLEIVRVRREDA
jgi:hypothetical protein